MCLLDTMTPSAERLCRGGEAVGFPAYRQAGKPSERGSVTPLPFFEKPHFHITAQALPGGNRGGKAEGESY
jgi:hypothetical protein